MCLKDICGLTDLETEGEVSPSLDTTLPAEVGGTRPFVSLDGVAGDIGGGMVALFAWTPYFSAVNYARSIQNI